MVRGQKEGRVTGMEGQWRSEREQKHCKGWEVRGELTKNKGNKGVGKV